MYVWFGEVALLDEFYEFWCGILRHFVSFPVGYDLGGVLTSSKRDTEHKKQKEAHCLYPGDLYPFTRRPLFVIVDSDNSFVFQHIPRYFGQPLVTLMSPQDTPPAFQGNICLN